MSYERIKGITKSVGAYRAARWVHRHVLDRREVQVLQSEVAFYGQIIRPGDLCYDVGANYGSKLALYQ